MPSESTEIPTLAIAATTATTEWKIATVTAEKTFVFSVLGRIVVVAGERSPSRPSPLPEDSPASGFSVIGFDRRGSESVDREKHGGDR